VPLLRAGDDGDDGADDIFGDAPVLYGRLGQFPRVGVLETALRQEVTPLLLTMLQSQDGSKEIYPNGGVPEVGGVVHAAPRRYRMPGLPGGPLPGTARAGHHCGSLTWSPCCCLQWCALLSSRLLARGNEGVWRLPGGQRSPIPGIYNSRWHCQLWQVNVGGTCVYGKSSFGVDVHGAVLRLLKGIRPSRTYPGFMSDSALFLDSAATLQRYSAAIALFHERQRRLDVAVHASDDFVVQVARQACSDFKFHAAAEGTRAAIQVCLWEGCTCLRRERSASAPCM
jgi:hypothetical protein